MEPNDFTADLDLASRALRGSVLAANDEHFAARENLILPQAPRFDPDTFGHKGKVYDGWETRRRRDDGTDWAIVRLGSAGMVTGIVVDTAYFKGNYPPQVSVQATSVEGHPSVAELLAAHWEPLVTQAPAEGDSANRYPVTDTRRWTHVRLELHPDGGVARLRVHGRVVPDPRFLWGTVDLVAAENGGRVTAASDAFFSSPTSMIMPGLSRHMGEGWENARRRSGGNDYVEFELAATGVVREIEIDTSYYVGNAPGAAAITALDSDAELLPRTSLQPDTRHRFLIAPQEAGRVRLDVFPDGGVARLRIRGELTQEGLNEARRRWWATLPQWYREQIPGEAP